MKKNIAIKVENLSKQYRLGEIGTGTLSHDLNRFFAKIRGKEDPYSIVGQTNDRTAVAKSDYVWALKDINFEVEQGEVLGIIGRNGAGKSTLLKLISQITSPTNGTIKAKGRIASLLEVGTGMHPEMTARENIYLNGAILGMTKNEIKAKFDEIIDFAGCQLYVDTPLKRFSSGMRVRLGFAVAAFLEPEILIVDEVLAVGDAEFQKKAIGKMKDISTGGGRTVLFVSHNMASVKSFCKRGILLVNGHIEFMGDIDLTVSKYLIGNSQNSNLKQFNNEFDFEQFSFMEIRINAIGKTLIEPLTEYDEISIETVIHIYKNEESLSLTYVLKNESGEPIFTFSHKKSNIKLKRNINRLICKFPKGFLNIGSYYLDAYIIKDSRETIFLEKDIISFNIQEGQRPLGSWMGKEPGIIKPIFEWNIENN
ncbi:MAG: Vitamin B12 import ATP-binding protein BtuD [Flavobacteriales bacterium]|nr:Vitamin B12 import ATP-binding protein BtuD [Flavobacteriales bacterium]